MRAEHNAHYFPSPESQGGWQALSTDDEVRSSGGLNPDRVASVAAEQLRVYAGPAWSIVVIRHGFLALELSTFNVLKSTRFDIWSGTKSFTATAWGILLSEIDALRGTGVRSLDDPIYHLIPGGEPLTDPRKAEITLRHLLSMTSGIPGETHGVVGMPTGPEVGAFEHALGRAPNRYGSRVDTLTARPGTTWDYSDPAFVHLALLFHAVSGQEVADFMQERVFGPIGIEQASWELQGGHGFEGPHTNAHTGLHLSARELARFGYLMLRQGRWEDQQIVPTSWIEEASRPSQMINPEYGLAWWVNESGRRWPQAPADTFALAGFLSNRCYIVPSLDLVVARVGSGPSSWNERDLIEGVVAAIDETE